MATSVSKYSARKNGKTIVVYDAYNVPKHYWRGTERINIYKMCEAFCKYGYVLPGCYVIDDCEDNSKLYIHNPRIADPFAEDAVATPDAPESASKPADDKSIAPPEVAPAVTAKAVFDGVMGELDALPKIEGGQPRTTAQNSEFHGIISNIAKALKVQPSDVKSILVKGQFGAVVHTKALNYEQMAELIEYAKGVAAYYGVEV